MTMSKPRTAITPTREEDYNEWYQQVVKAAELAEHSPVRGCMVIKPWGYGIWQKIQAALDNQFATREVDNFYCPLFIPKSYLEREAEHIDGFATECAVVTHHRLEKNEEGKLIPAGELEEPLIVRPTSETIIGEMFSRWVQSHRDLPLKLNQWANVVRWEMRTRLFLRTSEFLWQEGHTAHATREEAEACSKEMVEVYADIARNYLAMPVTVGIKSRNERFPGATDSYTIEAMMQDNKALQAGTSHFLGQTFAKAFNINFSDQDGKQATAWTTSWGCSTRLVGGLIMSHADDDGMVVPPRVAPQQVVILPIPHKSVDPSVVQSYCEKLAERIREQSVFGSPVRVLIDKRDIRAGDKAWGWVKKGAPIRIEIGPKELEKSAVFCGRRDKPVKEKQALDSDTFIESVPRLLEEIQNGLYDKALQRMNDNTQSVSSRQELEDHFANNPSAGFAKGYWLDTEENDAVEQELKEAHKITVRCLIPDAEKGTCLFSEKPGAQLAIFARAY
jgi:prolyl-tRNA synthetase